MTSDQAADILNVTPSQIYKLVKARVLRAKRIIRHGRWQFDVNGQDVQKERKARRQKND
jgi:excisionase family DNA binding protein